MKSFFFKNSFYWFIFLPFWFYALIGSMLYSGYLGDDAYNSQIQGDVLLQGITIWERYINEISGWLKGTGRFYPLAWLNYFWYYYVDNLILTKLTNFLLIYFGVLTLALTLNKLKRNELFIKLVALSVPIMMQFTIFMDPITAFTFLLPSLFLFFVLSLLFLALYLESGKSRFIILSFIFYLLSILTYEVAYVFWIIHGLIIYSFEKDYKNTLIKGAPIFFLGLSSIASYFIMQWYYIEKNYDLNHLQGTYPIFSIHIDSFGIVFHAFLKQIFGILPFLNSSKSLIHNGVDIFIKVPLHAYLIFFICIGYIYKLFFSTHLHINKKLNSRVYLNNPSFYNVSLGMFFIFLSAAPVALSGHQQKIIERTLGNTYLTEYIQYFGVAIIVASILYYIITLDESRKFIHILKRVLFLFFVFAAALTMGSNNNIVNLSNSLSKNPRNVLENSIKMGILEEIEKDDVIIRKYRYPHDNQTNYSKLTKTNLNICRLDKALYQCLSNYFSKISLEHNVNLSNSKELSKRNIFYLDYKGNIQKKNSGSIFIDRILELNFNNDKELINMVPSSTKITIYNETLKQKNSFEHKKLYYYSLKDDFNKNDSDFK